MYALAASAAGLGVLACSPHAEAEVVYTNTWAPIPGSGSSLDLNNDGITDFQFRNKPGSFTSACGFSWVACFSMKVLPQNPSNAIWGTNRYASTSGSASALGSGVSVGSQGKFQAGHELMAKDAYGGGRSSGDAGYFSAGPWRETTGGYLGLKFIIQGQVHYGWARLDVTATTRGIYAAITGYAYETEPNTPILTGQENRDKKKRHKRSRVPVPAITPGGLGMLAGGAPGLQARQQQDPGRK
jgi:hypothetical protein